MEVIRYIPGGAGSFLSVTSGLFLVLAVSVSVSADAAAADFFCWTGQFLVGTWLGGGGTLPLFTAEAEGLGGAFLPQ